MAMNKAAPTTKAAATPPAKGKRKPRLEIKRKRATAAIAQADLVTDPEGAVLLNMGLTRFGEVQKHPDFPKPIWLGPRSKRHLRSELLAYALKQRNQPSEPEPQRTAGKAAGKAIKTTTKRQAKGAQSAEVAR
jgi:predicted DNA-binding transcriptional regulator AlpA